MCADGNSLTYFQLPFQQFTSQRSPDLWNFELVHAGNEEVAKPRLENRLGVEYKLREDGIQSQRLSWLQASEGSRKLLWPKGFRDTVTLKCWNLP